ncbi:MAG TPA: LysR family transcriptional regulator [Saprospiraceae bacterium]|nr:LysR family transcriptional regulator [Saprospiraceae bacterium]
MDYQIDYRHLRYFLAVAEELHFRKAAEKLYISQPGLSRQIKQLENRLGIKLFERHNRKVVLTLSGKYLQEQLLIHFKQLDKILTHTKLLHDGVDGSLRLGYVGSAMQQVIPRLLLKFKDTHPNILIKLNELDNKQQITALLHQDIDFGFVRQERVPKGLTTFSAEEETFSLVLPKNHPISASNFKNLAQFREEHFILFDASYSESYYEKVMQIFDASGFVPMISHSTVNATTIYRLVELGFGISIVPTSLQYGHHLNIQFIELSEIKQRTTLKIVWNAANSNPVLKSFLRVIEMGW